MDLEPLQPVRHGFSLGAPLGEELQQLYRNGYEPLPLSNKVPHIKGWQQLNITDALIEQWVSQAPRTLGIRTGAVVGVDIDILSSSLADDMEALAVQHLGPSQFIRVGKSPKVMLFYRSDDGPVSKTMTSFYVNGDPEVKHRVEILGQGQQAGVIGVHSTELMYQWPRENILNYPTSALPQVSQEALGSFLEAASDLFESSGYTVVENESVDPGGSATVFDLEFDTVIDGTTVGELLLGGDVDFRCSAADFREGATNESSLHVTTHGMDIRIHDYGTGITHQMSSEGTGQVVESATGYTPVDRYIFIESENKYFVTDQYGCVGREALNTIHKRTNPGGRNGAPLMVNWLADQPEFRTAWGLTWYPCKYGNEKKYQTIQIGPHEMANTWEGFALTPIEGDVSPWLNHLKFLVPNEAQQQEVIRRLAFDIQQPWKKCNWHLVIWGVPGAGKDALITPLAMMFGNAASTVGNNDIKGDYDDGFVKKKLVTVSEVRGLSGSALEEMKRKAATENAALMTLNPKKEAKITQMNLWSMVFITNHRDAMKLSPDERRFYVLNAATAMTKEQTNEYFHWLKKEQGAAKLMRYLLDVDLTGFDPNFVPSRTQQFYDMIDATDNDMEALLRDWNESNDGIFKFDAINPEWVRDALLSRDIKWSLKGIKNWLDDNGWHQARKRIIAKIDGAVMCKSRLYRIRNNSEMERLEPAETFHKIEEIEAKVTEMLSAGIPDGIRAKLG